MSAKDLRKAREARGWTQQEAAKRLHLSQGYLSMLERGRRLVPKKHFAKFQRLYSGYLSPTVLPLSDSPTPLSPGRVAKELGSLGYAGYAYLRSSPGLNPAELLLRTLEHTTEARLVAGLPWLVLNHLNMDWQWVLEQSKLRDLQNRLGFVLALACELALRHKNKRAAARLAVLKETVEQSRLAKEDTFSDSLTQAEKEWLRNQRSEDAKHWNVLTDLSVDQLSYA